MTDQKVQKYREAEDALFRCYGLEREEHFIPIDSLGIRVRAQVTGKGHPILFVHGGPNAGSTWAELASMLSDFQCILLDRPGCGLSEAPNGGLQSKKVLLDCIVAATDAVLDHFQQDKVTLVGSSFGGYWGLLYTLQRPKRIERLIQEGCPAMVEGMVIPDFMKTLTHPVLRWLIPKLPTSKSYSKKILKEIGHTYSVENGLMSDRFAEWYVSLTNHTDTMKNEVANINRILVGGKMHPDFVLSDSEIQRVTCPTLWLWGEDDPFGSVDLGRRLHSQMADSQFVSFPNSGHLPWLDQPKEHASKIAAFVL